MKILFFTRRFYPLIGGVEKHVMEISKELVCLGNEVTVITEGQEESIKYQVLNIKTVEENKKIEIYRIPITVSEKLKKFQIWQWLWKNRNLIKEADIIHCHDVFYWYLPFRFLYPKRKVFTTFHGYEGSEPPRWNQIVSHKIAGWLSWGSMAIGDWHKKWYGINSEVVSYGAVGDESHKSYETHKTHFDFCFIGRLAKDTGIMVYLEALRMLKNQGKNFNLVVCGEGPQMNEAVKYVKEYGLAVKFEGFVNDVGNYLDKVELIFVSRYLGILEALLAKKLIFAVYNNEIKKDYLKLAPFSSYIVIEKDAVALAEKISYFANRPGKSKERIEKGFSWAKRQTWDKLINQYLSLWSTAKFRLLRLF